ncbi:MAG TPA: RDD family protein [Flavisolibacter sp.]
MNPSRSMPITAGIRLVTMLLDHFFMTIIALIFFLPGMISGFAEAFNVSHEQTGDAMLSGPAKYLAAFGFALYFCKDIFNGRSIAKRIFRLQVVDKKTGRPASPFQTLIRNFFCIFWPVEVIVALLNTSRRLGDRVARTKLVHYARTTAPRPLNFSQVLLAVVVAYGLGILVILVIPSPQPAKMDFRETSFNQAASTELEQLLADSLGQYLVPDVRIYDTVNKSSKKYVSVILRLRENYISDDESYQQLRQQTTRLIYSRYPRETITGRTKYVYQSGGRLQLSSETIGTGWPAR